MVPKRRRYEIELDYLIGNGLRKIRVIAPTEVALKYREAAEALNRPVGHLVERAVILFFRRPIAILPFTSDCNYCKIHVRLHHSFVKRLKMEKRAYRKMSVGKLVGEIMRVIDLDVVTHSLTELDIELEALNEHGRRKLRR